ncbi:uncharacterized protein LOC136033482 [Artemia franciscana]|uniref:uncharacterized protein LOC136033482 n=1 Tax=Artemia franciscana TaxID=6661 RepID=UPI0032DAB4BC
MWYPCRTTGIWWGKDPSTVLLFFQVLFSIVFCTEWIPRDWRTGIILPLWKRKGSSRIYSNYCGITLLSVPGNLFIMALLDRCITFLRSQRRIQQAGFMPGRSTMEQIITMRRLVDKIREFQQKANVAFMDFKTVFDSVDWQSLWLILKTAGLPTKYCSFFERLQERTESYVQVSGRRSPSFEIHTGVR